VAASTAGHVPWFCRTAKQFEFVPLLQAEPAAEQDRPDARALRQCALPKASDRDIQDEEAFKDACFTASLRTATFAFVNVTKTN
jgi:hypothetical protein